MTTPRFRWARNHSAPADTDDLSPATEAWSRPDILLHAMSMLASKMDKPLETLAELKKTNRERDYAWNNPPLPLPGG